MTPVMVNCNPETVSTDYDVSSTLYFEPVTLEDVSNIVLREKPQGIIIQLGGQTPLKLAHSLQKRGFKILGTTVESVDLAEDRDAFLKVLNRLSLQAPNGAVAHSVAQAKQLAEQIGYPVLIRPSYVLGGRAMQLVHSEQQLESFLSSTFDLQNGILIDQYLSNAIEVDVDAICDGKQTIIAGVMEHIEEAGIHSGDSSCVMPPHSLDAPTIERIKEISQQLSQALGVVGFINIQFAVRSGAIFVLEANPRASRTIPFVSKATGVPWAAIGTRVIMGESLSAISSLYENVAQCVAVKSVVVPFNKFPDAQVKLGPEMRSTGEVMGIAYDFLSAYGKAQSAADRELRTCQSVWLSGSPCFSSDIVVMSEKITATGLSTFISDSLEQNIFIPGTRFLPIDSIDSLKALLSENKIGLVVSLGLIDETNDAQQRLRRAAIELNVPLIMSPADAHMAVQFITDKSAHEFSAIALQDLKYADQVSFAFVEEPINTPAPRNE